MPRPSARPDPFQPPHRSSAEDSDKLARPAASHQLVGPQVTRLLSRQIGREPTPSCRIPLTVSESHLSGGRVSVVPLKWRRGQAGQRGGAAAQHTGPVRGRRGSGDRDHPGSRGRRSAVTRSACAACWLTRWPEALLRPLLVGHHTRACSVREQALSWIASGWLTSTPRSPGSLLSPCGSPVSMTMFAGATRRICC